MLGCHSFLFPDVVECCGGGGGTGNGMEYRDTYNFCSPLYVDALLSFLSRNWRYNKLFYNIYLLILRARTYFVNENNFSKIPFILSLCSVVFSFARFCYSSSAGSDEDDDDDDGVVLCYVVLCVRINNMKKENYIQEHFYMKNDK